MPLWQTAPEAQRGGQHQQRGQQQAAQQHQERIGHGVGIFGRNEGAAPQNERDDWELPCGRLDEGEQPEQTIVREIAEELGVELVSPRLVDVYIWKKDFGTTTHIGIVTFAGDVGRKVGGPELNGEAGKAEFQKFIIRAALQLDNLPEVYKRAIRKILI